MVASAPGYNFSPAPFAEDLLDRSAKDSRPFDHVATEASAVETMAATRAPGGYEGGGDHGGRSWRRSSDRRRIIGLLCSVLVLAELGGLLIQVYLLLTITL